MSMQEALTSNMVYARKHIRHLHMQQSQRESGRAPTHTRHASSPAIQLWINMHSVCANTDTDLCSSIFVRTFTDITLSPAYYPNSNHPILPLTPT